VGRDHDHRSGRARGGPGRGGSLDAHRALNDRDTGAEAGCHFSKLHPLEQAWWFRSLGGNYHGSCRG
jgi:hypothetical protein